MRSNKYIAIGAILLSFVVSLGEPAETTKLKDAESATHGYDAAWHEIVNTYEYPGFSVLQINLSVLSHYSYLLVSGGEVLVIDPDRDIDFYVELAQKKKLQIVRKGLRWRNTEKGHTPNIY